MNTIRWQFLLCFAWLVLLNVGALSASSVYVTARISPLFQEPSTASSRLSPSLRSGDQLTQLGESEGFVQVRLPDGTDGWIPSRFVSVQPPEETAPRGELADLESRSTRRRANSYTTSAAAARGLREDSSRARENVSFDDYDLRAAEWLHGATRIQEREVFDFAEQHGIGF